MSCKCNHKHKHCDCKCVEDVCVRDLRKNLRSLKGQNVFVSFRGGGSISGPLLDVECGKILVNDVQFGPTFANLCNVEFVNPFNDAAGVADLMARRAARRRGTAT